MSETHYLENEKYISLETYKKNNDAVKTPMWFVLQDGLVYVVTRENTGKVKRLYNNQNVKIAACTIKGNVTGKWYSGIATKLSDSESGRIVKLRDQKYGFVAKIVKFATRSKGNFTVYSIKLG